MEREMTQNQAEQEKKFEQRAQTKDAFSQFVAAKNEFKMSLAQMKKKPKRLRYSQGYTAEWKKAIVTLTKDSKTIEFFEGLN